MSFLRAAEIAAIWLTQSLLEPTAYMTLHRKGFQNGAVFPSCNILACKYTEMLEKNLEKNPKIYLFIFEFQMCRIRLIVCLGVSCSIQSSLLSRLMLLLLPMIIIIYLFIIY